MLISVEAEPLRAPGAIVTDAQVEQHVKPSKADRELVEAFRSAAIAWVERQTGMLLEARVVIATFDAASTALRLPRRPARSIVSVAHLDERGDRVDATGGAWLRGDEVRLPDWGVRGVGRLVEVQYEAGFVAPAAVPSLLPVVALMLIRHLYDGGSIDDVPATIRSMIEDYRAPVIA